jgi:hypothetical protein
MLATRYEAEEINYPRNARTSLWPLTRSLESLHVIEMAVTPQTGQAELAILRDLTIASRPPR